MKSALGSKSFWQILHKGGLNLGGFKILSVRSILLDDFLYFLYAIADIIL